MTSTRKAYLALAATTTGLVALQFFLAGIGIFGAGSFDTHRFVGFVLLHATTLLMFLVAAFGRLGRSPMIFGGGLLVLIVIQSALPGIGDDAPVIAAFHPLLALVIFVGAVQATQYAARWRTAEASPAAL
jgi:hypothetical protein